jgi:MYXO-CTERM domain-containing protein
VALPDTTDWLVDADFDGYGDEDTLVSACAQPEGTTPAGGDVDCDDTTPDVNPGALELCENGVDDDCDGKIDEDPPVDWWPDDDKDGYGDASAGPVSECEPPSGHVANGADCDDGDPDVSPRVEEVLGNGIDDDCDGEIDNAPDTADTDTGGADTDTAGGDTDAQGDRPYDSDRPDDTGAPVVGGACGCAATGPAGAWLGLAALAGLAVRRRRR